MEQFTISAAAIARISYIKNNNHNAPYLRLTVEGGGCSGFQYKYHFTEDKTVNDIAIEKDNVVVLIDPISYSFLEGSQLDYIEELGGAYFNVVNPNATAKCGCGNSFNI
jgi:iron-sulfur cluster assembly accessory protein